ncbi:MAG: hypothetical protein JWQ81_7859 [Amycolatopsis sp.]|jgi:hypothetical protein|uniref:DUF4386 domain-containing protein n=1 Tax=Amycolatopsis sp. TaxID=37632 RepID=UPI00261D198C|nr:DUF4386 domain-containing protein [Amycolatopsis sp.]MCU1687120.1 hypothetical protein [Amycolatopsis sp.]
MVTVEKPRQLGPPLGLLAGVFAAFTVAYVAVAAGTPRPGTSTVALVASFQSHAGAMQVAGFLQFAAAIPLAILAATAYRRLRQLGITAPGSAIAFTGGLLSSMMLALCGIVTWTASQTAPDLDGPVAKLLNELSFALGGVGYGVTFALLIAGIAVPALILGLLPKAVAWAGLVIAGLAMLGTFALVSTGFDAALPIGRFGGLIWIVTAALLLPRKRAGGAARNLS